MHLKEVWIENLRCLSHVHLTPSERQNVLLGDNGTGKTSLLEGLFLLGRGQSFRQSNYRRLIKDGEEYCLVRAKVAGSNNQSVTNLAIQKSADTTKLKIGNESSLRLSDLARYCPVLIMEPGQHRLLEDGPNLRRRYLDWSVFHVEQQYLPVWQRYSRALRQRNTLLRERKAGQLSPWNLELSQSADLLDEYRDKVFAELLPFIEQLVAIFFDDASAISVEYRRGWSKEVTMFTQLEQNLSIDLDRGFTQAGPQRAEIRVKYHGHPARDCLSRGQQKLLISAMILGQAQHFAQRRKTYPLLLVDDLASELGASARNKFFAWLETYPGQSFISFLDETLLPDELRRHARMFHVKHPGEIQCAP